jgi:hypothetical protein
MPAAASGHDVSLVELLGAVSLATDLGTGQPLFHGVRTSVLAVALGRDLGLGGRDLVAVQHVALVELDGSGHVTYAERPDEFAAAVREFARLLGTVSHSSLLDNRAPAATWSGLHTGGHPGVGRNAQEGGLQPPQVRAPGRPRRLTGLERRGLTAEIPRGTSAADQGATRGWAIHLWAAAYRAVRRRPRGGRRGGGRRPAARRAPQ